MIRVVYHPFDPAKNQYFVDGKPVSKQVYDEHSPSNLDLTSAPGGQRPACWPMVSDIACFVHPSQAKEQSDFARSVGVPTEFTKGGSPIFTDAKHRREYCRKVERMTDRNAGYSDPVRD